MLPSQAADESHRRTSVGPRPDLICIGDLGTGTDCLSDLDPRDEDEPAAGIGPKLARALSATKHSLFVTGLGGVVLATAAVAALSLAYDPFEGRQHASATMPLSSTPKTPLSIRLGFAPSLPAYVAGSEGIQMARLTEVGPGECHQPWRRGCASHGHAARPRRTAGSLRRRDCVAGCCVVCHHRGRGFQRARGRCRLERWSPDCQGHLDPCGTGCRAGEADRARRTGRAEIDSGRVAGQQWPIGWCHATCCRRRIRHTERRPGADACCTPYARHHRIAAGRRSARDPARFRTRGRLDDDSPLDVRPCTAARRGA